jgi:hypothetical protein
MNLSLLRPLLENGVASLPLDCSLREIASPNAPIISPNLNEFNRTLVDQGFNPHSPSILPIFRFLGKYCDFQITILNLPLMGPICNPLLKNNFYNWIAMASKLLPLLLVVLQARK